MTKVLAIGLLSFLAACDQEEPRPDVETLDPRGQLIRLSVDTRGVHPSEAELAAIEANPALYDEYVDRYLEDPRFVGRVKEIFNLRYLTRTGDSYYDPTEAGLALSSATVADSLAEEPLALLGYIVENDLPFTEMVLADYTMANPITAAMWNIDIGDADGWTKGTYRDGRPHAGILSMQTIWERYPSMGGNANRHRANAVARMLLCDDYLTRPIVLNRAAVDQLTIDPEDAISTSDTCQSCHSTLDPLAAHFYGFYHVEEPMDLAEGRVYQPENEEVWRAYSGKEPGYYGTPTGGLRELAESLAADPRMHQCAVQTVFEGLTQRPFSDEDWTEIQYYTERFESSNLNLKELVRDMVSTDYYKATSVYDAELDERLSTVKTASPAQLAGIIEGITGYRWTFSGRDGLTTNDIGLPVLAGGIDANTVKVPAYDPGVGLVFVVERLAQAAAATVAAHDLDPDRTEDAKLLAYVTIKDTPESNPDAFDAQIRALYLSATGKALAAEATEPAELTAMWKELYSVSGSAEDAWAGVLSAVLRDPEVLFY